MERLKLLVAVAGHGLGERMGAALEGAGCAVCFHLSGQGTAKAAWLEMLGLSDTRKDVLIAPCPEGRVAPALAALRAAADEERFFRRRHSPFRHRRARRLRTTHAGRERPWTDSLNSSSPL